MQAPVNILILGETGVGKSTFINAFANYISYKNLQDALSAQSNPVSLIPMAFTHVDPETLEGKRIEFGMDPNERHDRAGMSVTQSCRTYTFELGGDMAVSLIDTPGVGDTLGVERDEQNLANTLQYLQNYTEIHGICVLLRANTPRLTVSFKYCIKELLRRLHRSACQNIVFVFTNARASGYTPGESVTIVKAFLADLPHTEIQLHKSTVYALDNEALRFLVASKQGVVFSTEDKRSLHSGSWDRAVREWQRLLQHVLQLPPHRVKETVSVNRANDLVDKLQQPRLLISAASQQLFRSYRRLGLERKIARLGLESNIDDQELQEEQDEIAEACATFAYFFETNSITPYNSINAREYVEKLIKTEETTARRDPTKLAALRQFLSRYEEKEAKLKQLARTRAPGSRPGPAADILELEKKLCSLKHSGKHIRTLVEAASQCASHTEFHEKKMRAAATRFSSKSLQNNVAPGRGRFLRWPSVTCMFSLLVFFAFLLTGCNRVSQDST